ncbi:nitric oxide synthase [Salipaludibacillus keqinensis]|uniref:Nitric oxide synthase oxygenase n=1 Tax=Salipaludibacillus keqinensis TaxID=2045207 RepID=A0A323TF53_9BACI|nr:nitric oxide synthase oxygenase [Salipaludibacillus keqinensis]PYZ92327.1 nitric oxide synthase [Salipaludibacillus keqinensis]
MNELYLQAEEFINKTYKELNKEELIPKRLKEIEHEIETSNHYNHTFEELEHGAKMAWRNANKCIGRLFWNTLSIKDAREIREDDHVFEALESHVRYATNKGKIRPTMTIFAPRRKGHTPVRIINHQIIRYAGYNFNNEIIGDPDSIPFTKLCQSLGWQGEGSHFDLLPLVIQLNDGELVWRSLQEKDVLQVDISHPELPDMNDLGLKWYAVPIISDMLLEIGGIRYPAAPFNGWYMGTEIGARNFADESRYNCLLAVAETMELDTSKASTLWKDRALVELNRAVLYSFQKVGVSIVDHHTAAEQFKKFEKNEQVANRELTGTWSWLIPPVSPAVTHIFHKEYNDQFVSPNFHYQNRIYNNNGDVE